MNGLQLIAAERVRHTSEEGWTPEHDDEHNKGEMAKAALCYLTPPEQREIVDDIELISTQRGLSDPDTYREVKVRKPKDWPWAAEWWKPCPHDRTRELVKAGALFRAEADRLRRRGDEDFAAEYDARADAVATLIDALANNGDVERRGL